MSNDDPYKHEAATASKEQRLAARREGGSDAEFLDDVTSFFIPNTSFSKARPHDVEFVDINPVNDPKFGQQVKFEIGSEGYAGLVALELHIKLPRLANRLTETNGAYFHPEDGAAYTTAGGLVADILRWVPYVGEQFQGGENDHLTFSFMNTPIRETTVQQIHNKRVLCAHDKATHKYDNYKNAVGAISDESEVPRRYSALLWTPHGVDGIDYSRIIPMHAFSIPLGVSWKVPKIVDLIQTNILAPGTNVVALTENGDLGGQPEVFIRAMYINMEKSERAKLANTVLNEGLTFKVQQSMTMEKVYVAGDGAKTVEVPLKYAENPVVYMVATVRMVDDTKAVGEEADHATLDRTFNSNIVQNPDRYNYLPIDSWQLKDANKSLTGKWSAGQWKTSPLGHTNFFPSTPVCDRAVLTFAVRPGNEAHASGHIGFTHMTDPKLVLELPALPAEEAGGTRVVEVHAFCHNFLTLKKNKMTRHYVEAI